MKEHPTWSSPVKKKNEKKTKMNYKILQNSFNVIYLFPLEKSFQLNKIPQTSGMLWTENRVKSHPIQWDIFPLDWKKLMNLHTRPPSMCADLCSVKWGGADRSGWIPVLLLPSPYAFPREAGCGTGAPDTFCKQISLPCHPGGQSSANREAPLPEITPANSAPRVRRQIRNAAAANNFCNLQRWQICQKHFGIELSLKINDPNGTQPVLY